MANSAFRQAAREIAESGRFLAQMGWSPATSSNYSVRLGDNSFALTRSGVDKYAITESDVITVNEKGHVISPVGEKPSAETLIHLKIYESFPAAGAVLHTHSAFNTRLSLRHQTQERLQISGYEMLKGLEGNKSHELTEIVPILPNSQDMTYFCSQLEPVLKATPNCHGFLIAGHGLYTWGSDMTTTRRHVETFEFLFSCLAYEALGF